MRVAIYPWPNRIRAIRARLGLTQTEVADRLRVGSSTVRDWEAGRAAPRMKSIIGAIEALEAEPTPQIPAEPWSGRVKALRGRVGMTQAEFAEVLQVTHCQVSRWEHGVVEPGRRMREDLARWEESASEA